METNLIDWNNVKESIAVGSTLICQVTQHQPFGVFVHVGDSSIIGIIERIRMHNDGFRTLDGYPAIGRS